MTVVPPASPVSGNEKNASLFQCRRCGHCCHGQGGIVVSPRDLKRLCRHLGMDAATFLAKHTEKRGGKPMLLTGPDGWCEFFRHDQGCIIHPARPDICRAWPYFRGNLVDEISFLMAREDCPGIAAHATHAAFAREGYAYLRQHDLLGRDPATDGRALIVSEHELPVSGTEDGQ